MSHIVSEVGRRALTGRGGRSRELFVAGSASRGAAGAQQGAIGEHRDHSHTPRTHATHMRRSRRIASSSSRRRLFSSSASSNALPRSSGILYVLEFWNFARAPREQLCNTNSFVIGSCSNKKHILVQEGR